MRIRILGSGTSTGVPEIGCTCKVCTSSDPKDNRLRSSAIVYTDDATILIDCGPDFRQQMLKTPFGKIDGVLVTHEHYDHVGGLDDLRPFCRFGEIPVYVEEHTAQSLIQKMPYCFTDGQKYPGVPDIYLKRIEANTPFSINNTQIIPLRVFHAMLPILGYRIGKMAYITDILSMPEENYELLQGLDVLILDALRPQPHMSHLRLEDAIEMARRIGASQTYFIHMSHQMGLHQEVEAILPNGMHLSYDELELKF